MKKIIQSTISLRKGVEDGWVLLPIDGNIEILDELYGGKSYEQKTEELKTYAKGQTIEEAKKILLDTARNLKFNVMEKEDNVFSLSKVVLPPDKDIEVDLKYALWSCDEYIWNDYAEDGILKQMEDAFLGEGPIINILTAPRKEIRYGTVCIEKGKSSVHFYTLWDEPYCHVPDDCPDRIRPFIEFLLEEYFSYDYNGLGYSDDSPIGAEIRTEVEATTFSELMEKIDAVENELIQDEERNSQEFHKWITETVEYWKTHRLPPKKTWNRKLTF